MPGFSKDEQELLSALIAVHRRRPRSEFIDALRRREKRFAKRLAVILRLAVRLNRNRSDKPTLDVTFAVSKNRLRLLFPSGWFQTHPLTQADLEEEARYLEHMDFELVYGCRK